jgi:hypothetical protein
MRLCSPLFFVAMFFSASMPVSATELASRYTRANDKKICRYVSVAASAQGPASCEFSCDGPVRGVTTRLLSCYDYEHLLFRIDGRWFSTWSAMTAIGGMSGLGNREGVVEWLFEPGARTRATLAGLIVRFQGVDADGRQKSALAVFSLRPGRICWKGNFATNAQARAAAADASCEAPLTPENDERRP